VAPARSWLAPRADRLKILTIVGARPQFIKAAAVSRPLRERHEEILLHTGQHYDSDMSDIFFRELNLPAPDIELGVGSGTHAAQTAAMLVGIEKAIADTRPGAVMVYGDTNSTLAGALAAAKLQVPVAHVEAGLRSFNSAMPEEINRVVTDRLSALLLCPSGAAVANLAREGIVDGVHEVGDVMADVLRAFADGSNDAAPLAALGVTPGSYVVATIHRAENTDDHSRLIAILDALDASPHRVLLPLHPRTRAALAGPGRPPRAVSFIDPLGYPAMMALVRNARAVVTDSGGLQKEAYWLRVPCITVRDQTEWVETVASGWNTLAGADAARITTALAAATRPERHEPLYGDGHAAGRIVQALEMRLAS
jgi:UDP-GlcNAc3NAcA epimerase